MGRLAERNAGADIMTDQSKAELHIHYCSQCNWLMRSAWLAQEVLNTFAEELSSVSLHPDTGGRFEIILNGLVIWERKRDEGFPDAAELKRRVRDVLAPGRPLGHVDSPGNAPS